MLAPMIAVLVGPPKLNIGRGGKSLPWALDELFLARRPPTGNSTDGGFGARRIAFANGRRKRTVRSAGGLRQNREISAPVPIRRHASGIKPCASIRKPPWAAVTAANRRMDDTTLAKPVPGRSARVVFIGERIDFIRLVRRGAFLELATTGFYRFWLATDIRRVLWSGTSIEGDAAEYTGTARELLIGFLFALTILVPIYLVYFLIGIEVERAKVFASLPLFLFFYAFGQFAIFRARRYRATRTVWRGVRFWMSGSGWAYSGRACLWTLATFFTLGFDAGVA